MLTPPPRGRWIDGGGDAGVGGEGIDPLEARDEACRCTDLGGDMGEIMLSEGVLLARIDQAEG